LDFHNTLLKSGQWLPAAFQEFSANPRILSTNRKEGIALSSKEFGIFLKNCISRPI
jgi:hypothetical protein